MATVHCPIPDVHPGDRVIHAPHPAAPGLDSPAAVPFESSDADWDDMARWCEWCDRNDEIRRSEDADAADAEARPLRALSINRRIKPQRAVAAVPRDHGEKTEIEEKSINCFNS